MKSTLPITKKEKAQLDAFLKRHNCLIQFYVAAYHYKNPFREKYWCLIHSEKGLIFRRNIVESILFNAFGWGIKNEWTFWYLIHNKAKLIKNL
jgi:hypothetical protein